MIKGTLIKTFDQKRRNQQNKQLYETIAVWWRDENGNKKCDVIDRPKSTYYILKDKNDPKVKHSPVYTELENVNKVEVYSDMLYRDIAERTKTTNFYDKVRIEKGDNSANEMKNLFRLPEIYNADQNIEDQYIAHFYRNHEKIALPIHKCYYDIETDACPRGEKYLKADKGFPDPLIAPDPIDIITLIDGTNQAVYSFIHQNPNNQSLLKFKEGLIDFKKELKLKLVNDSLAYNDKADEKLKALDKEYNYETSSDEYVKAKNVLLEELKATGDAVPKFNPEKIEILFYSSEVNCIKAFFDKAHELDPDYMLAWNGADFDFRTLVKRLINLYTEDKNFEGDPTRQAYLDCCDKKYMQYKTYNGADAYFNQIATVAYDSTKLTGERFSTTKIVDGINWIDQMELYGVVHSGEGTKDSYQLDAISRDLLHNNKLEWDEAHGENIKNAAHRNFRKFTEYNIRDVLLLFLIEDYTKDVELLNSMASIMYTRREKSFSQSIALQNYIAYECIENGMVMNSNKNVRYGDCAEYFKFNYLPNVQIQETNESYLKEFARIDSFGALVSDPTLNNEVGVEVIPGRKSMYLFNSVIDFDFSSLYPSIIRAFNIDGLSLVGRYIVIDKNISDNMFKKYKLKKINTTEDRNGELTDNVGEELADEIMCQDWNTLGKHFMLLPSIEEMIEELKDAKN